MPRFKGLHGLGLAAVLAAAGSLGAPAQTSVDGALHGLVRDRSGAVIPDASIRVESVSDGLATQALTDRQGSFLLPRLSPGPYRIRIQARGFSRALLSQVTVTVGGVTELAVQLQLATVTTSVTVQADSSGASSDQAGIEAQPEANAATTTLAAQPELTQLPVNGRRWQSFALLNPSVSDDPSGDGLLSFRALPATQNSTTLDGVSSDQSFGAIPSGVGGETGGDAEDESTAGFSSPDGRSRTFAGGTERRVGTAYSFSQEAVREFRVSVQNGSALYGRGVGGVISTVSKSGTNTLHGAGFYLARDSAWGAANPFAIATSYTNGVIVTGVVKPHDLRQQFGGSFGGALLRDRLFYFYTLDLQRRGFPAVSSPGDPNFYALTATQRDLLGNRGVTSTRINAALNYLSSLTGTVPRRQDQQINFFKLDGQLHDHHRLSAEYNRVRMDAPAGARSSPVVDRGLASLGNSYVAVDTLLGRWLWSFSPRWSNELRLHFGHELQYETAQTPLPQEAAIGPGGYAPQITIGPQGLIFGTPASLGRIAYPDEQRLELRELLTWSRGHHLVQLGGDLSFVHDRVAALNNIEGTFHYDSGFTRGKAGGLVDWITDYTFDVHAYPNGACPSILSAVHDFCFRSYAQSFGQATASFPTQEWAGFVEDTWRLRPGLSLKVGLRYEYQLLPFPQQPNPALDAVFGATGQTSRFPEDRNNLGLRVGLSWQPFGATHGVVRLGYGQYYGRLAGATIKSALVDTALASSATHIRIVPGTVTLCPQVAGQGFGYVCSYVAAPPSQVAATTSAMVFDRHFRLPAVQQGNLTLEHGLGRAATLSATYLLNLDRQLMSSVDINIAPSTVTKMFQLSRQGGAGSGVPGVQDGETFVLPVYTARISPAFGPVTDIVSSAGATFHALVLEAHGRAAPGLDLRIGWTWAKALDFGQSGGAVPRTNAQFDPFNVRYDRGLAALGHSHRLVATVLWEPHVHTAAWLQRTVNHWTFALVATEASGRPYSYNIFGGTRLSGGHESINGSGGAVYLPTVGRDTVRLPDTSNLDLRVSRAVQLRERITLRAMAEVFNVANHVNLSSVTTRAFLVGTTAAGVTPLVYQDAAAIASEGLNVNPFGTPIASGNDSSRERQMQLGLRLEF